MDYLAGNVQLVIAIFDLIIYKKLAIHLTEMGGGRGDVPMAHLLSPTISCVGGFRYYA